ncbi:hypothetical protein [Porphyrobacter sp. YT40]|uniref:OB-fold protein n=1 Tax=Porphyrobacter sp. YT40 TaxID=2547601 RepID=UPI0015E8D3A2|nr:hypothetical protein [Porphyrobacter sp. YT40]
MRSLSILGILVGLAACGEVSQDAAVDPNVPPIEVTSVDLAKAFEANEVAAKQTYGAAPLLVSGKVAGITLDLMDKPVVQLPGVNDFQQVQASFAGDATAATAQLQKGQDIVLLCESVSEVIGSPMLDGCTIQPGG